MYEATLRPPPPSDSRVKAKRGQRRGNATDTDRGLYMLYMDARPSRLRPLRDRRRRRKKEVDPASPSRTETAGQAVGWSVGVLLDGAGVGLTEKSAPPLVVGQRLEAVPLPAPLPAFPATLQAPLPPPTTPLQPGRPLPPRTCPFLFVERGAEGTGEAEGTREGESFWDQIAFVAARRPPSRRVRRRLFPSIVRGAAFGGMVENKNDRDPLDDLADIEAWILPASADLNASSLLALGLATASRATVGWAVGSLPGLADGHPEGAADGATEGAFDGKEERDAFEDRNPLEDFDPLDEGPLEIPDALEDLERRLPSDLMARSSEMGPTSRRPVSLGSSRSPSAADERPAIAARKMMVMFLNMAATDWFSSQRFNFVSKL